LNRILAAAALLALAGCAGCGQSGTYVWGVALADHPIEGGTVSVVSSTGATLASRKNATGPEGNFFILVPELPESYTVVVADGSRDGHALVGDFKAAGTLAETGEGIYVSPVSSLAVEYAATKPGLAPEEALAKVKDLLGIPAETDTRSPASSTEPAFDPMRYLIAAERSGGLDAYEAALAARMDSLSSGSLTYGASAADELLMEAVKGAAGAAGQQAAGWVLNKAGVNGDSNGLADLKLQLDEIQSELKAMSQEIQQVHLALLTAELEHRDETVRAGTAQVSVCTTAPVDPSTVDAAFRNGEFLRDGADALVQPFPAVLTDNAVTNQSGGGLFHEYRHAQMAKAYWTRQDVDGIRGQFGYYQWLQACEYLLVAEYLHHNDTAAPSPNTASPVVADTIVRLGDTYLASLALQREKYLPPVTPLHPKVIYSTKANLMVAYAMVARYDDRHYAPKAKGIRRSDKDYNPGTAVTHFNKQGGGPGGHKDWRLPTKDEVKILFSGSDYGRFFATSSTKPNHLSKGRIIWTSEWENGWAFDTEYKDCFNYNHTYDPDSAPDRYDGIDEPYSPGPASIVFVRTVNRDKEGYWSTPLK